MARIAAAPARPAAVLRARGAGTRGARGRGRCRGGGRETPLERFSAPDAAAARCRSGRAARRGGPWNGTRASRAQTRRGGGGGDQRRRPREEPPRAGRPAGGAGNRASPHPALAMAVGFALPRRARRGVVCAAGGAAVSPDRRVSERCGARERREVWKALGSKMEAFERTAR